MKKGALSITAIVFLGLFLLASAFIFVFERQLVSASAGSALYDPYFSAPFVVPWESAVLIAAAVFEIIFTAKGGKRLLAAVVPLAAVILGRIAETVQLRLAVQNGVEMVSVISIVNAYANFITPLFLIGSGFMFVCTFSDQSSKKLLYAGTALVSFAAAAVIILLFPFSAAKAVNSLGYIISAGMLIFAAFRRTTAAAVVSGVFFALHTAAQPFIAAAVRYLTAHLAGEDELTNFWISNIYAVFAGFILTIGAVMILAYCAAVSDETKEIPEKNEEIFNREDR